MNIVVLVVGIVVLVLAILSGIIGVLLDNPTQVFCSVLLGLAVLALMTVGWMATASLGAR